MELTFATPMWALLGALLILAIFSERVVELFKKRVLNNAPYLKTAAGQDLKHDLTLLFSLALGVIAVQIADPELRVLDGTPLAEFNPYFMVIVVGVVAGALSNLLHYLYGRFPVLGVLAGEFLQRRRPDLAAVDKLPWEGQNAQAVSAPGDSGIG